MKRGQMGLAAAMSIATLLYAGSALSKTAIPATTTMANPISSGTPTQLVYRFNVAAGSSGPAISLPSNVPVTVRWYTDIVDIRNNGVMMVVKTPGQFLQWSGFSETGNTFTGEAAYSGTTGTHMMWLDFGQNLDFEVNNANTFRIVNVGTFTGPITVTLTY